MSCSGRERGSDVVTLDPELRLPLADPRAGCA